jgi:hypothetical protein
MFARSLLLLTALLLLIAAVSSVLAPRELRSGRGASSLGAAAANPAPPPGPGDTRELTFRLPGGKAELTADIGDIVHVQAAAETDDVVEIADLGISAPVSPGVPAAFDVIPDHAGRFPVTLRYSGRRIGVLEVQPVA